MLVKFLKFSFYFLFIPFWWVQRLLPRKNNVWLFGGWYGLKYSDNSKDLYEYITINESDIYPVWLTRRREVFLKLKSEGKKCVMANSLKGIYYSLKAGYVIISSGRFDVNPFFINGAIVVNTWHGAPMKKIGKDDVKEYSNSKDLLLKLFFPFIREFELDAVVSTSDIFTPIMSSAFGLPKYKVLCSGYPRNDILYSPIVHHLISEWDELFKVPRKIFYLPTFRDHSSNFKPFENYGYNEELMHRFLNETNSILISKGHYVNKVVGSKSNSDRIIHLNDKDVDDLNFLIKDVDILITDYSGVYFDFLLTQKPILFASFDYKEYISKHRELNFNYNDIICGTVAEDWKELIIAIKGIIENDIYSDKRKQMNDKFNKYHDSQNSERLYKKISQLIK